jgi:hypothetical protein
VSERRELDLALQTAHAKMGIDLRGMRQLFTQEVKGMAVWTFNIHQTKGMRLMRILILLAARRDWMQRLLRRRRRRRRRRLRVMIRRREVLLRHVDIEVFILSLLLR